MVAEFLVHVITRAQETLFTHWFHVHRLPEQIFNRVTVRFPNLSLSSCFPAVQLKARPAAAVVPSLLTARCCLAGLHGFLDVCLHKINVPIGKICKQLFSFVELMWSQTHRCLLITQLPKDVHSKVSRWELPPRLQTLNYSSRLQHLQLVSGCGSSTAACNHTFICMQRWCHAVLKSSLGKLAAGFPATTEVRGHMWTHRCLWKNSLWNCNIIPLLKVFNIKLECFI